MYELPVDSDQTRICPYCGTISPATSRTCQGCKWLLPPPTRKLIFWWWISPTGLSHLAIALAVPTLLSLAIYVLLHAYCAKPARSPQNQPSHQSR
jgi:hypothetical protein